MKLIDCHTHTQFSVDSEADLGMCAERADRLGLVAYAVTDHCECNSWYPAEHYSDGDDMHDSYCYKDCFLDSVAAVTALKEKYNGKLNLICGVEMGQPQAAPEAAAFINADERVDFIIGSLHQIRGEKDFYYIDYIDLGTDKIYDLLERYFTELNEMCRTNSFDVLGHLTYCLRYMKQRHGIEPDISRFDGIIADSFRTLAQNGKGIEINTSGLRQGFGETFPNLIHKTFPRNGRRNNFRRLRCAYSRGYRQKCPRWHRDRQGGRLYADCLLQKASATIHCYLRDAPASL